MTESDANALQFDDCELDLASRELTCAGSLVALEPRVFELLAYLIDQRQRAVDKEEIQEVVWKGAIVSETALTRAIMKARRAVGDSAEKQAVIRTVHGHGYQFVASLANDETSEPPIDKAPSSGSATPRIYAGLVALTIVSFIAYLWPGAGPADSVRLAIMPVENATDDPDLDWTRLGLMGFGNDLIVRSAELSLLPASDVMRFAERKDSSADDASDLEQLKSNYGATHMLVSRLEENAGGLRLTYSLFKPDGEIERGTMVGAAPTELIRGMIRSVGKSLGNQVVTLDEITVISEDSFINEAYSRGLGLSLQGRCAEALQLFEVVTSSSNVVGRAEYEWASCARILGRWQEAEAGFREILAETPTEPSSSLRALALNGLGTVYIRTGRGDAARDTYKLALVEANQAGDYLLQGMVFNSLAIDAKNRREFSMAREFLERAMLAYTEADAGLLPGQLPAAFANIDMAEGKFDQAERNLQRALVAFRMLGDRRNEAMMLNNFGYLRRLQGRPDEAEPLHLQSLEIRREIGDHVGQGRILGMLSTLYEDDGRLEEARDAAAAAYRIASEANDKLFMATGLAQLAHVEMSAGEIDTARLTYVRAREIFEEIGDYSRAAQTALRLARIEFETGDLVAADTSAREILEIALREVLDEPAVEAMELSGDIALEQSDATRAISAYEDALAYIDETGFVSRKTKILTKLANLLLDQGDFEATEPLIGYLIEQGNTAESLKLRARHAFVLGDADRSVKLMESAQATSKDDWSESDAATLAEYRNARKVSHRNDDD